MVRAFRLAVALCFCAGLFWLCGCRKAAEPEPERQVVLPQGVILQDRTFHSDALNADVTYRIIRPEMFRAGERAHVLYLLHGNGSGFREWSIASPIAELAAQGYVLVMPEGHSTYFMNSASNAGDRYEDFITRDLVADAERGLPVSPERSSRSIAGVSMGGFAAIVLALKHPYLYGFAGALSPPVDFPRRSFTFRRLSQSLGIRRLFGPEGSATRSRNDPFVLAKNVDPDTAPYIFLSVGAQEGLRDPVQRFDALLRAGHLPHEFHMEAGGHDWQQWNRELPGLIQSLNTQHKILKVHP